MSIGFNKVIIIGFLGHDPEIRYTQSGIAVTTLNIAVSERRKDKDDWVTYTDWFNVICLGKSAESVEKFLRKGRQVFIEGKLQNRLWEDQNGNKNVITEIITRQIIFLGKNDIENKREPSNLVEKQSIKTDDIDNDIPF